MRGQWQQKRLRQLKNEISPLPSLPLRTTTDPLVRVLNVVYFHGNHEQTRKTLPLRAEEGSALKRFKKRACSAVSLEDSSARYSLVCGQSCCPALGTTFPVKLSRYCIQMHHDWRLVSLLSLGKANERDSWAV